jgi:precorrin-6y C5,15-methyltransferase (decarboxylating) CbiE subunit
MIYIVGVGPGTREYMTAGAESVIAGAAVVIAGKRLLELVPIPDSARRIELPPQDMPDAAADIVSRESHFGDVVLLVSGDPGFYSLAKITEKLSKSPGRDEIRVIPGISSLQLMASRICRSWAGIATETLHGRSAPALPQLAEKLRGAAGLSVLLGPGEDAVRRMRWMASDERLGASWAAVGWDLGLPGERVLCADSLRELVSEPFAGRLALLWMEDRPKIRRGTSD